MANLSYWERDTLLSSNFLIIGGGIVGLSAAAELKSKYPYASVRLLERGLLPTGASTKNAGFACFGSLTELLSDLAVMPENDVLLLVEDRLRGLELLRKRVGDAAMEYEALGGYELLSEKELYALEKLEATNALLRQVIKGAVYQQLPATAIRERGFNTNYFKGLVLNAYEGQLHTGRMMATLQDVVQKLGVSIHTGAEVDCLEDAGDAVWVHTNDLSKKHKIVFRAEKVLLCTNAFSKKFKPEWDLVPGRGQVLITEPVGGLAFKGAFHFQEGYFYFRNVGNRVLLGGGRHLAKDQEAVTDLEVTANIMGVLEELLSKHILHKNQVEIKIEQRWAGIMCFSQKEHTKKTILEFISPNVLAGVRLNGMGVAIGSRLAQRMVAML